MPGGQGAAGLLRKDGEIVERKIDKIKRLEKELGRYRKKSGDQARTIASLNEQLSGTDAAVRDLSGMVDAILIQTALTYGEDALDEESGEKLGVRLRLPEYRVEDLLARYEVRARPDRQAGEYVVGVVPRGEKDG